MITWFSQARRDEEERRRRVDYGDLKGFPPSVPKDYWLWPWKKGDWPVPEKIKTQEIKKET